jgi:hypothetical protein
MTQEDLKRKRRISLRHIYYSLNLNWDIIFFTCITFAWTWLVINEARINGVAVNPFYALAQGLMLSTGFLIAGRVLRYIKKLLKEDEKS